MQNTIFYCAALDNPSNLNVLRKRDTFVRKNFAGVTFLNPGETIKVKPRSPLPKAADAVVPVENTLMLRQNANVRKKKACSP